MEADRPLISSDLRLISEAAIEKHSEKSIVPPIDDKRSGILKFIKVLEKDLLKDSIVSKVAGLRLAMLVQKNSTCNFLFLLKF